MMLNQLVERLLSSRAYQTGKAGNTRVVVFLRENGRTILKAQVSDATTHALGDGRWAVVLHAPHAPVPAERETV